MGKQRAGVVVVNSGASPIIGITMGDPAGIGPELCLRALVERSVLECCTPVVFGDLGVMSRVAETCNLPRPRHTIPLAEWKNVSVVESPTIIDCGAIDPDSFQPGNINAACGRAAYTYIEESIHAALDGKIAAVVTAPINKEALHLAGIDYPGHTEIFADLTGAGRSCMMLWSGELVVSFVTSHIAYADVPAALSIQKVLDTIELTDSALTRMMGRAVKLAVCGLNPHAGEHGLFGQEEQQHIQPATVKAQARGIDVTGPVPADTGFLPEKRRQFDAIICMYHDQGHIPFKMLAFERGVNVTLGLPIVRTSVDHGTAFDIAWKGIASAESLFQAVLLAGKLCGGRGGR